MGLAYLYRKLLSERELGKPLSSKMSQSRVTIYRAVVSGVTTINDMDYVTLSRKFAVEHAESNTIVNDEVHDVIGVEVSTGDVYDATNPGEYFYSSESPANATVLYTAKGYDYEGWEELESSDFTDGKHDNRIR